MRPRSGSRLRARGEGQGRAAARLQAERLHARRHGHVAVADPRAVRADQRHLAANLARGTVGQADRQLSTLTGREADRGPVGDDVHELAVGRSPSAASPTADLDRILQHLTGIVADTRGEDITARLPEVVKGTVNSACSPGTSLYERSTSATARPRGRRVRRLPLASRPLQLTVTAESALCDADVHGRRQVPDRRRTRIVQPVAREDRLYGLCDARERACASGASWSEAASDFGSIRIVATSAGERSTVTDDASTGVRNSAELSSSRSVRRALSMPPWTRTVAVVAEPAES